MFSLREINNSSTPKDISYTVFYKNTQEIVKVRRTYFVSSIKGSLRKFSKWHIVTPPSAPIICLAVSRRRIGVSIVLYIYFT